MGPTQIGDAGEDADRLEGLRLRRTAAAGNRRPGVGTDDGDGLDFGRIEREQVAFVLEQGDALARAIEGDGAIGDGVGGVGGVELGTVEEAVAQHGAEQAQQLVVDGRFLDRAILDWRRAAPWHS